MEPLGAAVAASLVLQKIVEHIRRYISIEGVWVFALSSVLGVAFVAGTDLRFFEALVPGVAVKDWLDTVVSGFALASGAGFIADISDRDE